ncbi:MAG TPA: DNA-binding protein [bacterium]|uniref:PPC domain-containing protein n=1 Tax=candidate division TA06 bacterium ADurb.Bin417 TaxID=1852828 RepID=A0A1V5M9P5_UNCT6|nr:MAG: hypothetical protein BWY73_01424 [candidate division TA06 bacterium ADurb.Bin417]HNQ35616.1 DNA-binding protein [bacterium]HNS47912.1 DNA-binding protein [bacterium]
MEDRIVNELVIMRLQPGENLMERLVEAGRKYGVRLGVVVSGLGTTRKVRLGYFRSPGNYDTRTFEGVHELLALSGGLRLEGNELKPHLHATVSGPDLQAWGGHLLELEAAVMVEVVLRKIE